MVKCGGDLGCDFAIATLIQAKSLKIEVDLRKCICYIFPRGGG